MILIRTYCHFFHNTKITNSKAALSSYQKSLFCVLHSEIWSSVWMGNSNKSTFIHLSLKNLDLRDSHDVPSFPPTSSITCRKSCFFLSPLQSFHPSQLQRECLQAHFDPKIHCSSQFLASFLNTKTLNFWVYVFLEDEKVSLGHSHQWKLLFP